VSQVIVVGVVIGLYELLLRILNRILSHKGISLGNREKHKKNKKEVIQDRQKT